MKMAGKIVAGMLAGLCCWSVPAVGIPIPEPGKQTEETPEAAAEREAANRAAKAAKKASDAEFFAPLAVSVQEAPALRIADLTGSDPLLMAYFEAVAGALGWSIELVRCRTVQEASGDFDAVILEDRRCVQPLPGQVLTDYAVVPVLFAASGDLPLKNLSVRDLKRIYSGRISYWDELDPALPHLAIRRIVPDQRSAAYRAFALTVMGQPYDGSKPQFGDEIAPDVIAVSDWRTAGGLLSGLKGVIAFGPWAEKMPKGLHFLAVDGVPPKREAVTGGRYPAALRRWALVRQGGVAEKLFLKLRDPALPEHCQIGPEILQLPAAP